LHRDKGEESASARAAKDAVRVRFARAEDAALILELVRELTAYQKEPLENVKLTEADILRDCFGPSPRIETVLAEADGRACGFVVFFHNYSTWAGRPGLYLLDVYVRDWARGLGVGRRLMAEMAALARARGAIKLDLSVLHWNPARGFYERLGFVAQKDWQDYRLSGAGLERLAEEAEGVER
jgi:ribosomal protein S18 acetylase RimI-like enzyme